MCRIVSLTSPTHCFSGLCSRIRGRPLAFAFAFAASTGYSHNAVQPRLERFELNGTLENFDRRIDTAVIGYPLSAYVFTTVKQKSLSQVEIALASISEILQFKGISGNLDLVIEIVSKDAEDLYRIATMIPAVPDIKRTRMSLVIREMGDHRMTPLLRLLDLRSRAPPRWPHEGFTLAADRITPNTALVTPRRRWCQQPAHTGRSSSRSWAAVAASRPSRSLRN